MLALTRSRSVDSWWMSRWMQLFSTRRPSSSAADPVLTAVQQCEQPCLEQVESTHATNSADVTTLAPSNAAVIGGSGFTVGSCAVSEFTQCDGG